MYYTYEPYLLSYSSLERKCVIITPRNHRSEYSSHRKRGVAYVTGGGQRTLLESMR